MDSLLQVERQWERLHERCGPAMQEIEKRKEAFPALEGVLASSLAAIGESGVLQPPHVLVPQAAPPQSPEEAISFHLRHLGDESARLYRIAIENMYREFDEFQLTEDGLIAMHRNLLPPSKKELAGWKQVDNIFPQPKEMTGSTFIPRGTLPAAKVDEEMKLLLKRTETARLEGRIPPLFQVAALSLDLFGIHPFIDGNGRITRLCIVQRLLQEQHRVLHYASLEGILGRLRLEYICAITESLEDWLQGTHRMAPWVIFLARTVLGLYDEATANIRHLEQVAKNLQAIDEAVADSGSRFLESQLRERLPSCDPSLVGLLLRSQLRQGKIHRVAGEAGNQWSKAMP